MFGFSKKEIFMNMDPELFFRITAALKEHGIRYETKHVNGTTVNWMTGTAASVEKLSDARPRTMPMWIKRMRKKLPIL